MRGYHMGFSDVCTVLRVLIYRDYSSDSDWRAHVQTSAVAHVFQLQELYSD